MAKERYTLLIMVEKQIYHDEERHNMGPVRDQYVMVPGEHKTLKLAVQAAEELAGNKFHKHYGTKNEGLIFTIDETKLTLEHLKQMKNYIKVKEKEFTHGKEQESSLPSEGKLPGESDHHRQHRSRDGSRV